MVIHEFKGNLTAVVRSVILEAWRERWTEERWSMAIKKYLPYIDATDPLLLSNILLEQATISASPNVKLLDYLKYAIISQMTTFSAAVQNIIVYKDVSQPYCLSALVGFLSKVYNYPFSNGATEEPLDLSKSFVLIKAWLLELALRVLQKLEESKSSSEILEELLRQASQILCLLAQHDVCNSLMCLSLSDVDSDPPPSSSSSLHPSRTYGHKLEHLSGEIGRLLCQPFSQPISDETRQALVIGTKFDNNTAAIRVVPPTQLIESNDQFTNLTTNILVVMETYLFPCNDMQVLAEKLVILEQIQGIERPRLYSEILRSCYMGLLDEDIKPEDIKWSTFVYIRVPSLFVKLLPSSSSSDKQAELCTGIELLLDISYLLDAVDSKCNSDCLQFLVNEFIKHSLLTETHVKRIMNKRQSTSMRTKVHENPSHLPKEPAYLILKAEPTLITILKSLDAQKNPEMNLRVMNPLMCGKSFELVSSVAAATGKLQSFVARLIRINEVSKMPVAGEPAKNSQIRATAFDISFLLLCHIVQIYDLEVVSSCTECRSTFFYQWATRCLPDGGRIQSAEVNAASDPMKMTQLLEQLRSEGEFKMSILRWDDACITVPQLIHELLKCLKLGAVSHEFVKNIVDTLKSSMCSLAVVATTWLCNTIGTGGSTETMQAEMFVLQQLSNYSVPDGTNNNNGNSNNNNNNNNNNNYLERSYLARQFINFLVSKVESRPSSATEGSQPPHTIYSLSTFNFTEGRKENFVEIFQEVHYGGYLKVGKLLMLERIYEMSSCTWFVQTIVEAMLSYVTPDDLTKGVCTAHSLFHIDLEELTACLIESIIPVFLLASESNSKHLSEPQASAIIRLAVMNLALLGKIKQSVKDPEYKINRKRKRQEYFAENPDENSTDLERPFKIKRDENGEGTGMPLNDNFLLGDVLCSQKHFNSSNLPTSNTSNVPMRDHLTKPLTNLLNLFHIILLDTNMGPQTDFVLKFIKELLKTGTLTSRYILQNSPPNLSQLAVKFLHGELTTDHIFMFRDVSNTPGKSIIAKAIFQAVKQKNILPNSLKN